MNNINEYDAIELYLGIKDEKRKSKRRILWQYYANIFQGLIVAGMTTRIILLLRRKMMLLAKLKKCQMQEPLEVETVPHLIKRWESGNYRFNSLDLLQNQLEGVVMKNVFLIGKCKYKTSQLVARTGIDVPLNQRKNIDFLEGKHVRRKVWIPNQAIQDAFLEQHKMITEQVISQVNVDMPVYDVRPLKNINASSFQMIRAIFASLTSLAYLAPKLKLAAGNIILKPSDSLCVLTDLIFDGKNMRLINTKWIGKSFAQLSETVAQHYQNKIYKANKSILLMGLGIAAIGAYRIYSKLFRTITKLQIRELEQKYPRITEVTHPVEEVVIKSVAGEDPLICQDCKVKNIDLIFIPCFHFQICRNCMDISGTLCKVCNQNVYCGIPVYFA